MTTETLPALAELTPKQAKFVALVAQGWLRKEAYRAAYDCEGWDDKSISVEASRLARNPNVAPVLNELLRTRRMGDLTSAGKLVAQTLEDQEAAREDKAHAAVVGFARLIGNWAGMEQHKLTIDVVRSYSDDEVISRIAGEDPERIKAARIILGRPDGFPDAIEADYEMIPGETDNAAPRGREGREEPTQQDSAKTR